MTEGENIGTGKKRAHGEQRPNVPPSRGRSTAGAHLVAFTIDGETARLVKLESVDSDGARHELSEAEAVDLASATANMTLERLVEQAFEAGLVCLLEDGGAEVEPAESEEEADLRHLLLKPLMAESGAQRLIQSELLNRAILGTLLRHGARTRSATGEGGPVQ